MTSAPDSSTARRWPWRVGIALLALVFGLHAVAASLDKSSTYDEPLHMMSSWLITHRGDFRVNPEHPALWKYVAGIGLIGQELQLNDADPRAINIFAQLEQQWFWLRDSLYSTPERGQHTEHLVARARVALAVFPIALGVVVAFWAWRWGGPVAAIIALVLLSLDPNLLAHGALVTNDVAASLWFALAAYLTWSLGKTFRWGTVLALALVCAAGIGTKFTCLLLAPMVGVPLLYRLFDRGAWLVDSDEDAVPMRFARRLRLMLASVIVVGVTCWLLLWPLYQFRAAATPDGMRFDDRYVRTLYRYYKVLSEQISDPTAPQLTHEQTAELATREELSPATSLFYTMTINGLVPQAWGFGLNYANARSFIRGSYLMGETSPTGFGLYFPLALAFKTPLASIVIIVVCGIVGVSRLMRHRLDSDVRWKAVCLLVPPAIYFGIACMSPLNIGLRHVLPVLAPAYVAAGVLLARGLKSWKPARVLVPVATIGLAVETIAAFPNYLPFFNVAAGGSRGGLRLLGDSNLDWGQDLPALSRWYAAWRAQYPNEPFYLSYFGNCPPTVYGIDYINAVPGSDSATTRPISDLQGGVYAVSATHLQSIYSPGFEAAMKRLRRSTPLAIVNGSIYIYAMQPAAKPSPSLTAFPQPTTLPTSNP